MKRSWFALVPFLFCAISLQAQEVKPEYVGTTPEEAAAGTAPDMGFNPWVTLGGNVSFGHNQSVIGKVDGHNWTLGASLDAGFDYQTGPHDWRNRLLILETFTYGPPINEFVKSADQVTLSSDYYYIIPSIPWLGPFARFQLDTSFFPGDDTQASYETHWSKDGRLFHTGKRLKLTDSFLPLTLREAIGLFARPFSTAEFEWEFRLGLGSTQVFADGQMALTGKTTDLDGNHIPEIEVKDLSSYVQGGSEAAMTLQGILAENRFKYRAYGIALTPFLRNKKSGDTRNAFRMTNVELGIQISYALTSWASLDYQFRAIRQPQLIEVFQFQNLLLITFKHSLVEKRTPVASE